jgi:alanyl-tRNA synthetase
MPSNASAEPYVTEFETTVDRIDGTGIVLDETYFYPEGGGQPPDRGVVGGYRVTDVQSRDGAIVHRLDAPGDIELSPGDAVDCYVDPDFRTYCMRAHTASHALYGASRRLLDDLGYGGFGITDEKVRVDFSTTTDVDDATLVELERLVNRAVWDSHDVTWETVPREDALERGDVAFNTKTEEGLSGETVRLVTIEDWDVAACGGTHVRNTREIGPVTVLDRSNPGEGLTRVEFAVGPAAIRQRATEHERAREAARELDTRVSGLPDAVRRLREEREDLVCEVNALTDRLVERRLETLRKNVETHDGDRWLVGDVPGLDANGLAERAQSLAGENVDVVVLVDGNGEYVAVASACDHDAGDLVGRATDAFGGGGGGSPSVAQAGGLDADAEAVVDLYRRDDR